MLIDECPDLVLAVRRDGSLIAHCGGSKVPALVPGKEASRGAIADLWPADAILVLKALCRKSIDTRALAQSSITVGAVPYEIRATAAGPDRVICTVRLGDRGTSNTDHSSGQTGSLPNVTPLTAAVNDALALAALKELPAALLVFELDGIDSIARLEVKLANEVSTRLMLRIRRSTAPNCSHVLAIGAISNSQLAIVLDVSDRLIIEEFVTMVRGEISRAVQVGQDSWHVNCYVGASLLGRDANTPKDLLAMATIAASEACRGGVRRPQFFSDTMKLRTIARLDIAGELRRAVLTHRLGMRYLGRYELLTGRLDTLVGYVAWQHPLRGRVSPGEFLGVAEASGNAVALSREMLNVLRADIAGKHANAHDGMRFSYGPLRHHLLHDQFVSDIEKFLDVTTLLPHRLEVRIAERTFLAVEPGVIDALVQLGTRVVVDEVGRSMGSFAKMSDVPLWGMQLDRAAVEGIKAGPAALRLCRASILAAGALGLASVATGIDDEATRQVLLDSGCDYGSGDLFEKQIV